MVSLLHLFLLSLCVCHTHVVTLLSHTQAQLIHYNSVYVTLFTRHTGKDHDVLDELYFIVSVWRIDPSSYVPGLGWPLYSSHSWRPFEVEISWNELCWLSVWGVCQLYWKLGFFLGSFPLYALPYWLQILIEVTLWCDIKCVDRWVLMISSHFTCTNEGKRNWWKATQLRSEVVLISYLSLHLSSLWLIISLCYSNRKFELWALSKPYIDTENNGITIYNHGMLWYSLAVGNHTVQMCWCGANYFRYLDSGNLPFGLSITASLVKMLILWCELLWTESHPLSLDITSLWFFHTSLSGRVLIKLCSIFFF